MLIPRNVAEAGVPMGSGFFVPTTPECFTWPERPAGFASKRRRGNPRGIDVARC
jgi:hypothetical protein